MQVSITRPPEMIYVAGPVVTCDGGCGPLGHPLVYLRIGRLGYVDCPYCGCRFKFTAHLDDNSDNASQR